MLIKLLVKRSILREQTSWVHSQLINCGLVQREHRDPLMGLTNSSPHYVHTLIHSHYHEKAEVSATTKYKRHANKENRVHQESKSGLFLVYYFLMTGKKLACHIYAAFTPSPDCVLLLGIFSSCFHLVAKYNFVIMLSDAAECTVLLIKRIFTVNLYPELITRGMYFASPANQDDKIVASPD